MSNSSGPSTCRRSARSRNVSESSESSSWLSSDGRGNAGPPARRYLCPDSGSLSDNNSPERVKRKKRRKNLHDFKAEERKKVIKRCVAELVKLNRLEDELLRLKLKDSRVPLVLLKRLEHVPISQPKPTDGSGHRDEPRNQKKLANVPEVRYQFSIPSHARKNYTDETRAIVKLADEAPAGAMLAGKPRAEKKALGRPPCQSKHTREPAQSKDSEQPKLEKETLETKLPMDPPPPPPKFAIEIPQLKLVKETTLSKLADESHTQKRPAGKHRSQLQPKLPKESDQPKLAKETPPPKLAEEIPEAKLTKEIPEPKLPMDPPSKVANEKPRLKLADEPCTQKRPLGRHTKSKHARETAETKFPKEPSQPKLANETPQPKLAKQKTEEKIEEQKGEEIKQQCTQMTNVILPRTIDPSILKRRLVVRINKRQTDRLVANKISLQRRLLKELSVAKEKIALIGEFTPVNSVDSDKCAARLTEKSNDCSMDVNKCTKNPIVSSYKKQLRIPNDKSSNDKLPEKLLEDNLRCTLNSLPETSVAENQPESSKSFVHSNRKNKRKTIDQINGKDSINLVEKEPKCITDTAVKEDEKHSDDSSKDVETVSHQTVVKSNKKEPKISDDTDEKGQLFSVKEIKDRQTEATRAFKVLKSKNPTVIRARPKRNLASKSDSSVDSNSDTNEKVSKKLDKVIQDNLKCQAEDDKIVAKNEAEKCDIQNTVENNLDNSGKSVEQCSKSSESDENLKYSKDETDCNNVFEKSNDGKKLVSECGIERHVENFVKCGDKLPEKLNKNINKRIKNQTEKSIKSTRNIHSKIEKQADNAQENHSSSQDVVKENNECQSNNVDIVTEKYNNGVAEPIDSTERSLEKSVTLVEESSENCSKNYSGKVKKISKKSIQSSVGDKTESLSSNISEPVEDVCEESVENSDKDKNECASELVLEIIKKTKKVPIKPMKHQKKNVETLCNEKFSKDKEKSENFVKNPVEKHADAKKENQISFNLTDVNSRPKRNIMRRNLEIYTNTCVSSKAENEIDKYKERLPENLNKNDAIDVGKRKSRKLFSKEEQVENVEQSKLENEKLPIEKSNEKVPEMSNVNTELKLETAIAKRSKRILDKNVKSTENLISSDVDNKESCTKESEKEVAELQNVTETCKEIEVQNNIAPEPALPLDKTNVNLIESVSDSVHNFIQENVSNDLNEASSQVLTVPKKRGRRRKSLPDTNEKIIRNMVKSASIPEDLQNQIEQSATSNFNDLKNYVKKTERTSVKTVKIVKKYKKLQTTLQKRVTRNSLPDDKSVKISMENKIDLHKEDATKSIPDKTESNENLITIGSTVDQQEKPIESSESIVTESVQNDVDLSDQFSKDEQEADKVDTNSEITNKRVTRKLSTNTDKYEMSIDSATATNSVSTEASIPDKAESTDTSQKIDSVSDDLEKQIESSEEMVAVQHNVEINENLDNSEAIVTEVVQNDAEMMDHTQVNENAEDLQKLIKDVTKNEIKNQTRKRKVLLNNKHEKYLKNSSPVISEDIDVSKNESKKRVTRSITDKNKSTDILHKIDLLLEQPEKPIENAEELVSETLQNDAEINGYIEDSQKLIIKNTQSLIESKKRVSKTSLNNHEKQIESTESKMSDEIEGSTNECKRITRKSITDNTKSTETLNKIELVIDHSDKPTENVDEVIIKPIQNDVEINGHIEESQKAIIENTMRQIENKKRVTRKTSPNTHDKSIENTTSKTSDAIEGSTNEVQKRGKRKSVPDKGKSTETLCAVESIVDDQEKSTESTDQVIAESVQNDVQINGYTEDSQITVMENNKSLIANKKRLTRKTSPNKQEKQIENIIASPKNTENSLNDCKKRFTRKSMPDKGKTTETLNTIESMADSQEKSTENTDQVIAESVQNDVQINGCIEEEETERNVQKEIIENTKNQVANKKKVTRKTSPNKQEKQFENITASLKDTENSPNDCKKRFTRKSMPDKGKSTETLHTVESIVDCQEKSIENIDEVITESVQNDVEINGYTEDSQITVMENNKSLIANKKRLTRKTSPNKQEKQIENITTSSKDTENSSSDCKKRFTRKSMPDNGKTTETLNTVESIVDCQEKSIENIDEVITESVQNDVEINGYTEDSQITVMENTKSQITNLRRATRKTSPNKQEKQIENAKPATSEEIEGSTDECKNKSGFIKRNTRKARFEKHVESVSSSDDKVAEETQNINKECSKSEKVARKVSPDKYNKQTENLIVNNLDAVINTIDEEDKILSERLDNKENTKTQIEVNARVTRNSSLKKDRHNKNLIENNVDCVHIEDNKDKNVENVVSTVKVFSKNLTDNNRKFRKTSVDKVNEVQVDNLLDNSSASLQQNLIEENEKSEGSHKRRQKEFTESTNKRRLTQNDAEANSVTVQHSSDEKHFAATDDSRKSTVTVENNRRVTRKSAEIISETIAKDSAKLTDHNLLPAAIVAKTNENEKNIAVCDESDVALEDSPKIVESEVNRSLVEAKGLVNSIKSFNEHNDNDTCTEILQVSVDVNIESQPNNDKQISSDSLTKQITEDTKTTVAVEIATDSVEKSEKMLECTLANSSSDQQNTVINKNDSLSQEQPVRSAQKVSLRAFRKVKEPKLVTITENTSVSTIVPNTEKEENRAANVIDNVVHESSTDNKDVVTELSTVDVNSSNHVIEENITSNAQNEFNSINISSTDLNNIRKLTPNLSEKSNENALESTFENLIADSATNKLDEHTEKLLDASETADKDIELIENNEIVNEDLSSNQESNESGSDNSFKSALDFIDSTKVETLDDSSIPIEEQDISDLNNLEIPQLDSLCSAEAFPTNKVNVPLEEPELDQPSTESLGNLEIPNFEPPNLDSVVETPVEVRSNIESSNVVASNNEPSTVATSNNETCTDTLATSTVKPSANVENNAKKRRLATLLELKRKCTENLDKKLAADYENQLKNAIDTLIASGSLDSIDTSTIDPTTFDPSSLDPSLIDPSSIDPSSDSCLGNATENDENFESLSDEFDSDENLASRLGQLNDLKIPSLGSEHDSGFVFSEEGEREKLAPKSGMSFLEMNAIPCAFCDNCFVSNRELKKHVKVQHRQRLVMKITKTDSNEHKTQLVEATESPEKATLTEQQEPPFMDEVEAIPLSERFPMIGEEESITDGEIKIIVRKESGSKNSHVVKEIKITPKSSDGGNSSRIPSFSPALSDLSGCGSSISSPALELAGLGLTKRGRGRPRKYPIFTETELIAKQVAAQVLGQEQEKVKQLQQETLPVPIFEPVESIIPPHEDRARYQSVSLEQLVEEPKGRVRRRRKRKVFDEDTEDDLPREQPPKKRRGRPPRKRPEQLLQELELKAQLAQELEKSQALQDTATPQQVQEPPNLQQVQESPNPQQVVELPMAQPMEEMPTAHAAQPAAPKAQLPQEHSNLQVPQEPPNARLPQPLQRVLSRPVPALVPSSMPIRIMSNLPLPLLTPTLTPPLRTATTMPPLRQTSMPPLRQTPVPLLIPSLAPMSMPSLAPLTVAPEPPAAPQPSPAAPNPDDKTRELMESLQEFILLQPEESKRKTSECAADAQGKAQEATAPESPDATDVSKPEKGLLTRKFGMTKELVVRLTKIDTVPKDCEDFNGDLDDSERIDGDPKESSDEMPRTKLKPNLPSEEGEEQEVDESSREPLSSVVRLNLRRKLENNNNHVNVVEKGLSTDSPRTQPSDAQAAEAATSDGTAKSDAAASQETTNNQQVVTPRRRTIDKTEADESQKAKLMMLMNASTPREATKNAAINSGSETPRALPITQSQLQQLQQLQQPQTQVQISQPLPPTVPQMQHRTHSQFQPQVQQQQQPVQTQSQTVLQLQQPQQFCILFIPDYDGNGPRDVAPTATIVNFQPVPDNEIHNKPLIYMPTTPTKISVDDHAKAYVCANCTKVLDLIGRLEASVGMTEEDKSAITCPYCSNHFQSLFYLEYHVMHEHLKCENEKQCRHSRVNSLRIPTHEVATEFESYITFALKCRSCYDIFGSVLALNDHVMHKHKTLVRLRPAGSAVSGSNAYPAPFVGKNGAIGAVLQCPSDCVCRIGIRSTDTPLQRQQMLKRCPNAMRRLEKIEPAAYEVYTCTLCKSTFLMKDEVVDHLMKMHEVSCKFPCYTCLTSFRSLQMQENHRCSETTLQDFDKLLNIAILPTNVGGKEHNNKFMEREDSSTDEYGAMKTTSPRAPPVSTAAAVATNTPVKNGMKRKNGATIAALSQLLSKKPKLGNNVAQNQPSGKRKQRKRACPKCKKRFAYRKSLHDHVIYEHIMKGEAADGPKKTAVELLMLLSNNRANYKRIEELTEMLNGYTDEDGVSLRKLAMMDENEPENGEDSSSETNSKETRTVGDVAQCIRCKMRFSPSISGNAGQSSTQDDDQRKPLLCDNCEGIAGPKTRRRGAVNNSQHSDDESSDSQSVPTQKMIVIACNMCPETFPTAIELKSHKRAAHAILGLEHLYSCDICTKTFASPRMLEKHKKIHRESVLDGSAKPEEDEANRSGCQNSGDNSKDSETNDSLNDKVNSSNRRDSSDSSGAGSKEPEEQLLDCSFCEEVCSSKVSLKNHLKREHGRRASICQFCNGLLIDTSEVRHMLDYHIVPSKTSTRQTIVRNNGSILHCDDSCMQEDVDELIQTLGKNRLKSLMEYYDFEGKCNNAIMRCPRCPELFATRESCRFHYVWIHDDNCLLCDETFRSGSSACQHKIDAHTSTASYLWCIQRLVTAIVNTLNLDPGEPSPGLYQLLAMRLDNAEEEARITSEATEGEAAEKGANEEASSATERFLEEVLSEDQLPDSGNIIEVVIGREDSEDDLLSMLNLSPNYECEQVPNASASPPEEEEEEEEVPPLPPPPPPPPATPAAPASSPTMSSTSVIKSAPTTPTAVASTSRAAESESPPIASSPTSTTTCCAPNICTSGVYVCTQGDGPEDFVLVVTGEDETTYRHDIDSLARRISETCEVFSLEEITNMLNNHFQAQSQNSDGGA